MAGHVQRALAILVVAVLGPDCHCGGSNTSCRSVDDCPGGYTCSTTSSLCVRSSDGGAADAAALDGRRDDAVGIDRLGVDTPAIERGVRPDVSADRGASDGARDGARDERIDRDTGSATDGGLAADAGANTDAGAGLDVAHDAAGCTGIASPCIPADWTPTVFNTRAPDDVVEGCPPGWAAFSGIHTVYNGLVEPGCESCTCGTPTGVSCSAIWGCAHTSCGDVSNCTGAVLDIPGDNVCRDTGCSAVCDFAVATRSGPTGGQCNPAGGAKMSFTWSDAHDLCMLAASIGICQGSECLPSAGGRFSNRPCVARQGVSACPQEFLEAHLFYGSAIDTRQCSGCVCGSPSGGVCSDTLYLYPCAGCGPGNGGPLAVNMNVGCATAGNGVNCNGNTAEIQSARYPGVTDPGSCSASRVVESGAVSGTEPWTVCCQE